MKKKILVLFLIMMTLGITGCGADSTGGADASGQTGSDAVCTVELTEGKYSEEKLDDSWDEATAIAVTLNGTSVECSDDAVRIQGSAATITKAGTYLLSGELTEGQIIVDVDSEDSVKLVLRQAAVQCSSSSPIYVANGKTIITLADGTENAVVDARTAAEEEDSNDYNAAIFAKDDLSFNGTGTLGVKAGYNHGIQSKNDLKFINGTYLIQSEGDALVGKDSVSVKAGEFTIQSGGDGIKATNEEESDQGYVMIDGGTLMAVGAAGMAQTPDAESSQTYVSERLEVTSPEGTALTVTDAAGNTLASMVSEKEFNWYCVSTPQMEDGASYQIRIGTEEYEVTGK